MPQERWDSPWKTEAERQLVIKFYKQQKKQQQQDIYKLERGLF